MKTVCKKDLCNGCMACVDKCPKKAITVNRDPRAYNAIIDEDCCIDCKACYKLCPRNESKLDFIRPIEWNQGWAQEETIRSKSSSGGGATAIIKSFLETNGYVCSCSFFDGKFGYKITNSLYESDCFAGSKYVKSNPQGVYQKIITLLNNGEKVLFIGLPCHVAAVKQYVGLKKSEKLYTVDLICHGAPDPVILEKYLNDHTVDICKIGNISFRSKKSSNTPKNIKSIAPKGTLDMYLFSYLKRLNLTANCYKCQYASLQRISDLTLGDSWGSGLSIVEQNKGISLFLIQNEKGKELVKMANLTLLPVDLDNAISNNSQLRCCPEMPFERNRFFNLFEKDVRYDKIMFKIFPRVFIKQMIKRILIKSKLLSYSDGVVYNMEVY